MSDELVALPPSPLPQTGLGIVPALFADAGADTANRVLAFFTAEIRNANTRVAYAQAVRQFCDWCQERRFRLEDLTPVHVAGYIEQLCLDRSAPTVKQHLAAVRMLFDYLVRGGLARSNPASSVRGPKYSVQKGTTPVLTAEEAAQLFAAIDTTTLAGLRDLALLSVMTFSFGRISAVLGMDVEDYHQQGKRCWFGLHEKGGKYHEVPAHRKAQEHLDAYIAAAGIAEAKGTPLFRTLDRKGRLTGKRLTRHRAWEMVKRRSRRAALGDAICNHSCRATGITAYLQNKGTLEKAQQIANHSSVKTTKLYDRTSDELSLDEIEKILI